MKTLRVPEATITRLSIYSRYLERMDQNGITTVSSDEIAEGVGVNPAKVRKDLAYFGEFGTRGIGYNVRDLTRYLRKILGLDQNWPLILAGAGNLGCALCTYRGFNSRGFQIVGVFDNDLGKIGKKIANLDVLPMEKMPEVIKRHGVRIGIVAVPPAAAQEVAEYMVMNGIEAILNFAPVILNISGGIEIRNVDLSVTLESLTFNVSFKASQLRLSI
ncbi:MAG: redox-sensing transcriptional repressor Rex [Desulfofundulus sp.]|uniref:redox-sensing transcriptional repressor Rex n=1 Tax=Desulfofundulus sp. TaxID=2282750 RepID=UPI003C7619A2